jgi:hypothetical protein
VRDEAQKVSVELGAEAFVSFELSSSDPGSQRLAGLTGTVVRADSSAPVTDLAVVLARRLADGTSNRLLKISPDGRFAVEGLAPGEYVVQVRPGPAGARPEEFASVPVTVGWTDVTDVLVRTRTPVTLRGQIMLEGAATGQPDITPADVQVAISFADKRPLSLAAGRPVVHSDWTFEIDGVMATGVVRPTLKEGWFLKSVRLAGRDITDTPIDFNAEAEGKPIEVMLTNVRSTVRGTVINRAGDVVTDCIVVVFSQDPEQWAPHSRSIAAARPDQYGEFRTLGLPPGRYFIAATRTLRPGGERDPSVLNSLKATASEVTVLEGGEHPVRVQMPEF